MIAIIARAKCPALFLIGIGSPAMLVESPIDYQNRQLFGCLFFLFIGLNGRT